MKTNQAAAFPPGNTRLYIIVGAYGSGKTEFAVNFALHLQAMGRKTALADLDIVNPYFRSREKASLLAAQGVQVIAPSAEVSAADLPAIPASLLTVIGDKALTGVIDAGGDRVGARALRAFAPDIKKQDPAVWFILNRSRPDNREAEAAIRSLREIEEGSGLLVTGLVNNTHLIADTTAELVLEGAAFAERVARAVHLPVVCHAAREDLTGDLEGLKPLLPLTLRMNRPWET